MDKRTFSRRAATALLSLACVALAGGAVWATPSADSDDGAIRPMHASVNPLRSQPGPAGLSPDAQGAVPGARHPEPGPDGPTPGARLPEPGPGNPVPGARRPEPGPGSPSPNVRRPEPGPGSLPPDARRPDARRPDPAPGGLTSDARPTTPVATDASPAAGTDGASESAATPPRVNLNTATAAELAYLPGIGPSRAEAILRLRARRPFRRIYDIMRVRGIGRATYRRLRPYLTLDGPTTLRAPLRIPRDR